MGDDGTIDPTDEDIEMHEYMSELWMKWVAAEEKCICGNKISFQDAFDFGRCWDCLRKEAEVAMEGW